MTTADLKPGYDLVYTVVGLSDHVWSLEEIALLAN